MKPKISRAILLILILICFSLMALGSGSNSDNDSKKIGEVDSVSSSGSSSDLSDSSSIVKVQSSEAEVQTVYYVGDILHDSDMDIVYIASGEYIEDNEFMQPADGQKYIFLEFAFINTSERNSSSVSTYSFECYADGYSCDSYYGGDNDLSATLSAGKATTGCIYFSVPKDSEEIEIEYEANLFTEEKITFVYEEGKDSGYVLDIEPAATAGALKVGETTESGGLRITYLQCFNDQSDNMFITPKDGYCYITCEFEFENISNSDDSISSFGFECYADGISCDGAFYRDDNISATISAGRKAKGTVSFEIPIDATLVEVEYQTNVWTSEIVVFDASER